MTQAQTASERLYGFLLDNIEQDFTWDEIQHEFGWGVSAKHAKRAARLAEQDGLCLVVPNPGNGWAVLLTANPSRVLDGGLFLGAVETGVRARRVLHDDFIVQNARGSSDADVRRLARARRREVQIMELLTEQNEDLRQSMMDRRREARAENGSE